MKDKLIVLLVPSLKLGGAERNLVWLGENLKNEGYHVQVWVYDTGGPQIPNSLDVIGIYNDRNVPKALNFFLRIYYLTNKIRAAKPFAIISFLESISLPSLFASTITGYHKKHLVSVRGNPQKFTWYYNVLVKLLYPKAKYVVIPSSRAADYLGKKFRLKRVTTVPNAKPEFEQKAVITNKEKIKNPVIAIGRFIQTKRFDLVIEIMATLPVEMRRLTLIGDGPLKEALFNLIHLKNIQVDHISHINGMEVMEYLSKASALLSASETECWPNVIVEALASGTPVLAADIDYGPSEIIQEGTNGFLFKPGDIEGASEKMRLLLTDENVYAGLAQSAQNSVAKYSGANIIKQWVSLIEA